MRKEVLPMKKDILIDAGIDYESGVERFSGHEAIYGKFLKMFPKDPNYENLSEALETGNMDKAFTSAHTLKGTAGNLSLSELFRNVSNLVEDLRAKKTDNLAELMEKVKASYTKTVAAISEASADE